MVLREAGQAELIRSNQKDIYYCQQLHKKLSEVWRTFAGARSWILWRKELDIAAIVAYFGLTTVAGLQTLGEEYVNIVQVNETKLKIPSTKQRIALVYLYALGPYVADKILILLERRLQMEEITDTLSAITKTKLQQYLLVVRSMVRYISGAHLAWFYLQGRFYHIAKRVTGITYVLVRNSLASESLKTSFAFLGYLALAQVILSISMKARNLWKQPTKKDEEDVIHKLSDGSSTSAISNASRCSLCLEQRHHSTATPCGHLFCWKCIMEWCSTKPECPLCRDEVHHQNIVLLKQYS